jgi:hypothetical protein
MLLTVLNTGTIVVNCVGKNPTLARFHYSRRRQICNSKSNDSSDGKCYEENTRMPGGVGGRMKETLNF